MDERTAPSAAMALRLSADIVTALAVSGALSEAAAKALLRDSVAGAIRDYPAHERSLRRILATMMAQLEIGLDQARRLRNES